MKRTTLMIEEEVYARFRLLARRRGTTTSNVLRDALSAYIAQQSESEASPLEPLIGLFDGPAEPLGAETEAIVAEWIRTRSRGAVPATEEGPLESDRG